MGHTDYFNHTGLSSNASLDKIKAAYRQLSSTYNTDITALTDAENLFKEMGKAHGMLQDPQMRAMYDIYNYLSRQHLEPKPDSMHEFKRSIQYHSAQTQSASISHRFSFVFGSIMLLIGALFANHAYTLTHQDIHALEERAHEAVVVKDILETDTVTTINSGKGNS